MRGACVFALLQALLDARLLNEAVADERSFAFAFALLQAFDYTNEARAVPYGSLKLAAVEAL